MCWKNTNLFAILMVYFNIDKFRDDDEKEGSKKFEIMI